MQPLRFVISDDDAQSYSDNGFLVVRNVLDTAELDAVSRAMNEVVDYGSKEVREREDADFMYGIGHRTGNKVLRRVEYVIDKRDECKVLLANPFILRSVEKLMGKDLFPTWDAMVIKAAGEGVIVPWHRDAGTDYVGDKPIFNVDFYLDEATLDTCLWVIPGSHRWPPERARQEIDRLNEGGFKTTGARPVPMSPGDVIFHDILVVHGSPSSSGNLRKVIYYEFRTAHVEARIGPHMPSYIPLKQQVLTACIERRRHTGYVPADETPFSYRPPAPYNTFAAGPATGPETYRYPHAQYWRR